MIGPLRLDLSAKARVATVTITNRGDDTMNLQADVVPWVQTDAPQTTQPQPTDDILVSPPISALPAGKSQIFRVALRHPLQPGAERAYRVMLIDVTPPPPSNGGAPVVTFRITHSLPLFVQTLTTGKPAVSVSSCKSADAKSICARLENTGDLHATVRKVTFSSGAWSTSVTPGTVLLAGGVLPVSVAKPASPLGGQVNVTVESDGPVATGVVSGATP